MRRGGAAAAAAVAVEREAVGDAVPELRARAHAGADGRSQAAAVHLDLRAQQEGPGRDVPVVRAHLQRAHRGVALLQHLRNTAGTLESIYRRGRDLRIAAPESPGAVDL